MTNPWNFYEQAKDVTLTFTDTFFGPATPIKGRLLAERVHGFDLPSGAWSLYGCEAGATPALFYAFVPEGKRKPRVINAKNVSIKEG